MHADPFHFDKSLPLLVSMRFIQKQKQKIWTLEVLILLLSLLKYDWIFLQLSFCETNFTRRNDITGKNVLNKPICDESINQHYLESST